MGAGTAAMTSVFPTSYVGVQHLHHQGSSLIEDPAQGWASGAHPRGSAPNAYPPHRYGHAPRSRIGTGQQLHEWRYRGHMEWWGYVTGGVGALGGIYGAWRSWKTERRMRPLRTRWVLRHHQNQVYELRSNMPGKAHDVHLEVIGNAELGEIQGDTTLVRPGGVLMPLVSPRLTAAANILQVEWTTRTILGPRRRSEQLTIPPAPGAAPTS